MNVISFLNKYKYIIILLILIIYLILVWRKTEGFDNSFVQYRGLPNKYVFDSVKGRYNNIFGFHKGGGFHKKAISEKNDLDKKISILNKLLDKLLNKFLSDDQDCVGDFTKYSDCDKDCGDGKQTRKFSILKKKGKRGEDCKYVDGYTETIDCYGGICQNDEKCEKNADCIERNCNPKTGKCEKWKPCSADRLYMCDEYSCKDLNDENLNDAYVANGSYLWNNTDDACFFKTPAEMKQIEKNIYEYSYDDPTSTKYEGECIYYQVNDGHGKCGFRKNIELGEDENPVCKKGWGPEPTTMNIKDACSCCAGSDQCDAEKSCECKKNKYLSNENGHWECVDIDLTKKCPLGKVMKGSQDSNTDIDGSGCEFCNWWEKYQPDDPAANESAKCVSLSGSNTVTVAAAKYLSSGNYDRSSDFEDFITEYEICKYNASGIPRLTTDPDKNHPDTNLEFKSNPPNLVTICDEQCADPIRDVESGGGLAHLQKQFCNTCNEEGRILSNRKCVLTAGTGNCASGSYSQNNYYCCTHKDMVIDNKIWTDNVDADSKKACKCKSDSYDCLKTLGHFDPPVNASFAAPSCEEVKPEISGAAVQNDFKNTYGYFPSQDFVDKQIQSQKEELCSMFYEYAKEADISKYDDINYSPNTNLVKPCKYNSAVAAGRWCTATDNVKIVNGSDVAVEDPAAIINTNYKLTIDKGTEYCKFGRTDNESGSGYQVFKVDSIYGCSELAMPSFGETVAKYRCNNIYSWQEKKMCKWKEDQGDGECTPGPSCSLEAGQSGSGEDYIGTVTDPCPHKTSALCRTWSGEGVALTPKFHGDEGS